MFVGSVAVVLAVVVIAGVCAAGVMIHLSRQRAAKLAPWKNVRNGMSRDEVRGLLGEPREVVPMESDEAWEYGRKRHEMTVLFTGGKVTAFVKPF